MPVQKLDHVNVRTAQLDVMVTWYTQVLGFHAGNRPDFPFPGAWMYANAEAVVHLVGVTGEPGAGAEVALKLEHFAFLASDEAAFATRLNALGEQYRRVELTDFKLVQYNIRDPDGNHIHVDFPITE